MRQDCIAIRLATDRDLPDIVRLLGQLGYSISCDALADQFAIYKSPCSALLVAVLGERQVVGIAGGHRIPLIHQEGFVGRVTALIVDKEVRRQGVGRELISQLEKWFVQCECSRFEVTSGDHRAIAHSFYSSLGYSEDERRFIKENVAS